MNNSDRLNLAYFTISPELEFHYDFYDHHDFNFEEIPNEIKDETYTDDFDEFIWDDV
jgi:hypothetical protein